MSFHMLHLTLTSFKKVKIIEIFVLMYKYSRQMHIQIAKDNTSRLHHAASKHLSDTFREAQL